MNSQPLALITGAGKSTGIGFASARLMGEAGFSVILTARTLSDAQARAAELKGEGFSVDGLALDVTDAASIATAKAAVHERFGRLDVLINNAATTGAYGETAANFDLTTAQTTLASIVFGAWQVANAFLPLLRESKSGRLVNVSSGAGSHADLAFGLTTDNNMGVSYAVAKAALNALTVKQAREERAHNVLVNAVCPGFTATFPGGESMGARPVRDGAQSVVWAALLPSDGPTGGFFRDGQPLGW